MSVATTRAVALLGLEGVLVDVEADLGAGLPAFVLVGLPDASLGEARDRVRSAAGNSGLPLPARKLTVNLSPASLPKHGSSFDLAVALAALAAAGLVEATSVARVVHVGELGLDGRTRPVDGVLPAVLGAARAGAEVVMVPTADADEAALVPGVRVVGVASLAEAALWHGADVDPGTVEVARRPTREQPPRSVPDLSDVVGAHEAVDACTVAAAGGHHLLLVGPPGAGKSMLASRLPGLLPDLDVEQALETASVRSLCGAPVRGALDLRPPFEAPHHTCSAAALVGGGSAVVRPGAASRATHGVLFLDEAPEFASAVLDCLRQPLESGEVVVHRSRAVARFPARFQLVAAANPCPCGQWGVGDVECTCTPMQRRRYLGRLSGPLVDRIDLQVPVARVATARLREADGTTGTPSTSEVRERVTEARRRAVRRLAGTGWRLSSQVSGAWLRSPEGRPPDEATRGLERALETGALTMRGHDRVLRVAWTLADLEGADRPEASHVRRALSLRRPS